MKSGPAATRFLLINSTKANPEGEGYVMGAGGGYRSARDLTVAATGTDAKRTGKLCAWSGQSSA